MWLLWLATSCAPQTEKPPEDAVCPDFPALEASMLAGQPIQRGAELPIKQGPVPLWLLETRVEMDLPPGAIGSLFLTLTRPAAVEALSAAVYRLQTQAVDAPCRSEVGANLYFYYGRGLELPQDVVCDDLLLIYAWEPEEEGAAIVQSYPVVLVLAEDERADPNDPCTPARP